MTEILEAMAKPDANGQIYTRRAAPKGLMPSTWLERTQRVERKERGGNGFPAMHPPRHAVFEAASKPLPPSDPQDERLPRN